MSAPSFELDIERIVLDGVEFDALQMRQFSHALQMSLQQHLQALPAGTDLSGAALHRLQLPTALTAQNPQMLGTELGTQLGTQLAQQVWQHISSSAEPAALAARKE